MSRINVDMDGVLYPFMDEWKSLVAEVYPEAKVHPITSWYAWNHIEMPDGEGGMRRMDKKEFYNLFTSGILSHGVFTRMDPIEGAVDTLKMLHRRGWEISIVTSKGFSNPAVRRQATKNAFDWLMDHKIPFDHFTVVSGGSKTHVMADVVVDDKPRVDGWAQHGALNYLFGQPWNQEWEGEMSKSIIRVNGWKDISDRLVKVSVGKRSPADPGSLTGSL